MINRVVPNKSLHFLFIEIETEQTSIVLSTFVLVCTCKNFVFGHRFFVFYLFMDYTSTVFLFFFADMFSFIYLVQNRNCISFLGYDVNKKKKTYFVICKRIFVTFITAK